MSDISINLVYIVVLVMSIEKINNQNVYKIVKTFGYIESLVVLICLYFGIVVGRTYSIANRKRYDFGFINVNNIGLLSYSIITSVGLQKNKISKELVLNLLISYLIFSFSNSRTGFYCSIIFVVLKIVFNKCESVLKKSISIFITFVVLLNPLLIIVFYNKNLVHLDLITSNRFKLYFQYIKSNNFINLLLGGLNVELDSFYLALLFGGGILVYLLIFYYIIKSVLLLSNNNMNSELSFICSTLILGVFESSIIRPEILFSVLFWYIIINGKFKIKE